MKQTKAYLRKMTLRVHLRVFIFAPETLNVIIGIITKRNRSDNIEVRFIYTCMYVNLRKANVDNNETFDKDIEIY